ncbi:MAG TPA: anthranilate phosphoribosyltransferase [Candidatus Nitrosopolaris sp.]
MSSTSMDLRPIIRKLTSRMNLDEAEIHQSIESILQGRTSEASAASFLTALTMKGESSDEIRGIFQVVMKHALMIAPRVNGRLIDTSGTGGDALKSFNISTAAAIVAAAAGAKVAKHGNRSVSGICGSADFLEYVGLDLNASSTNVADAIENVGIGFLFAPKFHPAMRNIASARNAMGIRTVFNIIGPLCNPCSNLSGQIVGVSDNSLLEVVPVVMKRKQISELMVVWSHDGFDELSNTCENNIVWVNGNETKRFSLHPKRLGLTVAKIEDLVVHTMEDSVRDTLQVINGVANRQKEDVVLLNAAAALVVGRVAKNLQEGVDIARDTIKKGKSRKKLLQLIDTCGNKHRLEEAERTLRL